MALRRRGRDEPAVRRFQMREKLMSIGDDYWIEDDTGQRAFKVNGKAARVRDTWMLEDAHGREVASIRERKLSVRDVDHHRRGRPRGQGEEGPGGAA